MREKKGKKKENRMKRNKKKAAAHSPLSRVADSETTSCPASPPPPPRPCPVPSAPGRAKSRSSRRRQRIKKRKEAAANLEKSAAAAHSPLSRVADSETTSCPASPPRPCPVVPSAPGRAKSMSEKSDNAAVVEAANLENLEKSEKVTDVKAPNLEKLFAAVHYKYLKSLKDRGFICHTEGLDNYIYPKLVPRFPKQREVLSLDCGFDQTHTLKKILAHYTDDYAHSARHIISKSLCSDSKMRLKLRDIYSTIASSVVAVSSFYGVERKVDCSGFIVDWSSADNEGTILTSARVLCNPANSSYEFHVIVRMADGTLFLAKEDHVDFYHNILTLKVKSKVELNVLNLTADVVGRVRVTGLAERVVALGRSFHGYSFLDYVGELDLEYPSFGCDELVRSSCYASQICEGGPLISDTGDVVGISFLGNGGCVHVLPARIILSCLESWRSLGTGTVTRPWFGFSVIDHKQVDFQIWEKLNLSHRESYVLVNKVFEGSFAYKNDVRSHDLIASLNGIQIVSAHQYSDLLSRGVTDSLDSSQPFSVHIDTLGRNEEVSFLAEYLSIDDVRFYDCWPQLEGKEWSQEKFGSQKNPSICWPPTLEEET